MKFDLSNLRGDITGGITAGVVALPLALALGVASGLGPMAGMYGAIAVGFFAALFGGTGPQISGPTGPMVVVLAGLFASLSGDASLIFTAVILAGALQVAFGVLGIGHYIRLVPYPVISGFMTGIGVIIIILQLNPLLGHASPSGTLGALGNVPEALADIHPANLLLGLATLAMVYLWPAKWGRYVPAPLAALIAGTLVAFFALNVPVLGSIPTGLPELHLPVFGGDQMMLVVEAAIILAVLGSLDSLLTSLVADNMTRTRHHSNKELIGQGIGNAAAGFIGGIAGAGATMRTVVNIRSGGQTRISGMAHSLVLLAVALGLGPLAENIPQAVLAGILVKVGLDIIDWKYLKRAHQGPRWDLLLMVLVLGMTVFVDLITAVGVGVVLAALAYVKQVASLQIEHLRNLPEHLDSEEDKAILERNRDRIALFEFSGPLSFGAAADLGHHVREQSSDQSRVLILDFSSVPFLDLSAALAVETVASDAKDSGKQLFLAGMNEEVHKVLKGLNGRIPAQGTFDTLSEALCAAEKALQLSDAGDKPEGALPAAG
ncbi:SulP family inorganic anion transporter [Microbulbifer harenosus]|uniref:SulP family inorganic anion transporter n=1 Tax=Microbulbifer harenosus TaxID=2576840 RepID=A0ABY2UPB3_9GAMM|nr:MULTISPECIES: SulP family inorganic anion transporter [Microbulbifer]QIL89376.1 STAS domain-containing protein [Microbulbifer sp. SH-1]TLM78677.1 SulP family inorganic anion transporter [Microbulbifer harenosus]